MPRRSTSRAPNKLFYKIGEVCELTDTEPYVLRYWESEFPFLAPQKNSAGQRIYSAEDIETVQSIKRLLYEEGYTTAGARRRLEKELAEGKREVASAPTKTSATAEPAAAAAAGVPERDDADKERLRSALRDVRDALREVRDVLARDASSASAAGRTAWTESTRPRASKVKSTSRAKAKGSATKRKTAKTTTARKKAPAKKRAPAKKKAAAKKAPPRKKTAPKGKTAASKKTSSRRSSPTKRRR